MAVHGRRFGAMATVRGVFVTVNGLVSFVAFLHAPLS